MTCDRNLDQGRNSLLFTNSSMGCFSAEPGRHELVLGLYGAWHYSGLGQVRDFFSSVGNYRSRIDWIYVCDLPPFIINLPLCCLCLILPIQNDAKKN